MSQVPTILSRNDERAAARSWTGRGAGEEPRFSEAAPASSRRFPEGPMLGALLAVAALLRFAGLGRQSLWLDEVLSVHAAQHIVEQGFADQLFNGHGPLFFYLLAAVLPSDPGEVAARLLSAIFGVALVGVAYLLGKELIAPRAGLVAAGVMAVAPYAVWYSQEARYISLFMLLAGVSMLTAHRLLERGAARDGVAYVLSTVLMLFAFVGGVFLIAAMNLWAALSLPRGRVLARWATAQLLVGIVFVPWLVQAFGILPDPAEEESDASWVSDLRAGYSRETEPVQLGYVLYTFGVGFAWGPSNEELHEDLSLRTVTRRSAQVLPAVLIVAALGMGGLAFLWARSRRRAMLLVLCVLVPPLGAFALSLASSVAFNVRYTSAAFPAFVMILAAGLLWWKERGRWGAVVCAAAVALCVLSLVNYYANPTYFREDSRGVAGLLEEVRRADETLVVGASVRPLQFYYDGSFQRGDQVRLVDRPPPHSEPVPSSPRTWLAAMRTWQNPAFAQLVRQMRACYSVERHYRLPGYELLAFRTGETTPGDACSLVVDHGAPIRTTPPRPL